MTVGTLPVTRACSVLGLGTAISSTRSCLLVSPTFRPVSKGTSTRFWAEKLDVFAIVQGHVDAVKLVLNQLRQHSRFANLKKGRFHQDEVRFLGYVVSAKGVRMEDERIEAVKTGPSLSQYETFSLSGVSRICQFL